MVGFKFLSLGAAQQVTYNPGIEYSLAENPHGVWQYGYSATASLASQFMLDKHSDLKGEIGFWHPTGDAPANDAVGYYPYIAFNRSSKLQSFGAPRGWAVRAGEVAMEASNTGQYSLLRFVAPETGLYRVTAHFAGLHTGCNLSSTDVHVLQDARSLFDAVIEGYGGDESFHPVQGMSPKAVFSDQVRLEEGHAITFAVGYGRNKNFTCDTTGLVASITFVSLLSGDIHGAGVLK
jgi:hypothetical protein